MSILKNIRTIRKELTCLKNKFKALSKSQYGIANVSASRDLTKKDNNKILIIDGAVTLTFSGDYMENFNFNFKVKVGSSLTIEDGDKTLLDSTEVVQTELVASESSIGTVYQFDEDTFIVEGI